MKKTILMMAIFAIGFIACNKGIDGSYTPINPPVVINSHLGFEVDPGSPNRSVTVPGNLTLKTLLKTGSVKGGVLKGGWITFDSKGAFNPERDIKNFFMRIKDQSTTPATILYTSPVYASVATVSTLPQMGTNVSETKTYNIEFNFDVLSSATDNVSPDDSLILGVGFYYSHKETEFDTLRGVVQRIAFNTNALSTIAASVSTSTTPVSNVLDNQEITLGTFDFNSVGGVSTLTKEIFKFGDPQVTPAVSMLKMYDAGGTFMSSAVASGVVFTFNQSVIVPASKTITIKAVVGSVDETISGRSLKIILDKFEYTDVSNAPKFDDGDISANDQYVFAAIPAFTKGAVSTAPLVDSTVRDLSVMNVSSARTMGLKTFCYEIKLNDPNNNNVLMLKQISLWEGNTNVTSQYLLTKQNGLIDSIFTEGDSKMFFTKNAGNGESIITGGIPKSITLRVKIIGFSDTLKTDNIVIEFLGDVASVPFDFRNVNTGGGPAPSKLFNSNNPSSSASTVYLMWTDHSAGSQHSSGENISSADHFNARAGKGIYAGSGKTFIYQ